MSTPVHAAVFTGLLSATLLAACSQQESPGSQPVVQQAPVPAPAIPDEVPAPAPILAPAGSYSVDLTHATLAASISHLGLSNYVLRFNGYTAALQFDPDDLASSAIRIVIDPTSVDTDYVGDYVATHPDSTFTSWEEDLAMSDKFFNAGVHPEITFESTLVTVKPGNALSIEGDLTMLGVTQAVTLDAEVVGSMAEHPFTKGGAIGFSARGSFNRSDFGMDFLLNPPLLGDEITLVFEGEFLQDVEAAPPAG